MKIDPADVPACAASARQPGAVEAAVRIVPWVEGGLPLLERLLGDPRMMEHLGGPERPEKIAERQARYERPGSRQFRIVDEESGEAVGWVGYWERI
jgi:hypothetical protein